MCGLVFHLKYNTEITNKISYIRPDGKIIKGIYSIGLPAIISQALMSIMTYGMNMILKKIGKNAVTAMRLISLSFVFAGGNVAFQGVFQALDAGGESLVISICRQILFVLPPAWEFAGMAAGNNDKIWVVWCTFIIAEVMSFIIAALFMRKIYKRKIKTM